MRQDEEQSCVNHQAVQIVISGTSPFCGQKIQRTRVQIHNQTLNSNWMKAQNSVNVPLRSSNSCTGS